MSKIISQSIETVKSNKLLLENSQRNISAANDPHATRLDAELTTRVAGGIRSTRVALTSPVSIMDEKIKLHNITNAARADTIKDTLQTYQDLLSGNKASESKLVKSLDEFCAEASALTTLNVLSARQAFVDKGQRLASAMSDTVDGFKSLRSNINTDFLAMLDDANDDIDQLFKINQEMHKLGADGGASRLLNSQRDKCVNNLAKKFDIDIKYSGSGAALVSLKDSRLEIVSTTDYARFRQVGEFDQPLSQANAEDMEVVLDNIRSDGKVTASQVVIGGGLSEKKAWGGQTQAFVTLRDEVLKDGLDAIKLLNKSVINEINQAHNSGSPYPPKTKYESTKIFNTNDVLDLSGELSIFALDPTGKQLTGDAGKLHQRKIDFSKLPASGNTGKPTLRDVVGEFNNLMDYGASRPRAVLGRMAIEDGVGGIAVSNKEFLLNNIMLVGKSDVVNGEMGVDLVLEGNSYFGSTVEITGVDVINGLGVSNMPAQNLPGPMELAKDTFGRMDKLLKISNLAPNAANAILVQVRVISETGAVHEGAIQFNINEDGTGKVNKFFEVDTTIPVGGEFEIKQPSHTGVATARIVDANGVDITNTPGGGVGKLIIDTNAPDYRVAMLGNSNFSRLLGLNDFFVTDGDLVTVRDDIVRDPNNLSAGEVTATSDKKRSVHIGDAKASTVITFNNGNNASNLIVGDTVTVDSKVFTFGNAPGQIALGANLDGSLTNLVNAINADPNLGKKVFASINPGGAGNGLLKIEALSGGTWANNINLSTNLTVFGVASINGGLPNAVIAGNLQGGTDKVEARNIKDFDIGDKSSHVFNKIFNLSEDIKFFEGEGIVGSARISLQGFVSNIISVLSNQVNDAEAEAEVRVATLENFMARFKDNYGIDKTKEFMNAMQNAQLMKAAGAAFTIAFKAQEELQRMVSGI